jgi:cysteine desulfurase family protein (TIGR01976 family)
MPDEVIEAMASWIRRGQSNTHGAFPASRDLDALLRDAREAGADLAGADPNEIIFGANATTLLLHLAGSLAATLGPGDEVVVTTLDHDANVRPWVLAAESSGATVRWVDVHEDVTLDLDTLDAALGPRTRLVACTLASNAVGTIPDIADVVGRAKAATDGRAIVALDGVHYAQHRLLDLHGTGADLLVCSPYKFFGPHLGMVAARRALLETWTPAKLRPAPDTVPERWETGTQNHEAQAGMIAAVDYLAGIGRDVGEASGGTRREALAAGFPAIEAHERTLSTRFLEGIAQISEIRLWGIGDPSRVDERTPTFAVRVAEEHPLATAERLAARGIYVWDGDYYALELMERLGLAETGGAVRIGFCHYHSTDDVDRVLGALTHASS